MPTTTRRCSLSLLHSFDFVKDNVQKVCSSSTFPNTWTIANSTSLKYYEIKLCRFLEVDSVRHKRVNAFNKIGGSMAQEMFVFKGYLKVLHCSSRCVMMKFSTFAHNNNVFLAMWNSSQRKFQHQLEANVGDTLPP